MPTDFINELKTHALFHQATDEEGLRKHLASGQRRGYAGFDPTSDSFTIGNMVPMMILRHLQLAGHTPVIVGGGGTGLIGDPSGKSAERTLMTEEQVRHNVESQARIFSKIIDFSPGTFAPIMVNNLDWLGKLGYLQVLRDVGKHFSVNEMVKRDSVRTRLEERDQGISYTEFSYMILQAYDFYHLHKKLGVTMQLGGSDQWGNIVAGIDLISSCRVAATHESGEKFEKLLNWAETHGTSESKRLAREFANRSDASGRELIIDGRLVTKVISDDAMSSGDAEAIALVEDLAELNEFRKRESFGLTNPLITKSDGTKFGKSESGAIWMTPERTSPYALYQFWLNTPDADIPRFVRTFTFLPADQLDAVLATHAANPGAREAHRVLAREATTILHGKSEMEAAEAAAKALFSGEIGCLPEATLREVFAEVPSSQHASAQLEGDGVPLVDLLVTTQLATSKREAKEFLQQGSVTINGRKVGAEDRAKTSDLLHGSTIAIRRGKRNWHITRWS